MSLMISLVRERAREKKLAAARVATRIMCRKTCFPGREAAGSLKMRSKMVKVGMRATVCTARLTMSWLRLNTIKSSEESGANRRKKVESAMKGPGRISRNVVRSEGGERGFWVRRSRKNARKGAESLVAWRPVRLVKAREGLWKKWLMRLAVDETKVRKRIERVKR